MGEAPLILGVSGLRGIVGESLTPEVASRYAATFGTFMRERVERPRILLARDGRAGGEVFAQAAASGLRSVGCDVLQGGVLTTPSAGVIAFDRGCDAALIITASHNPEDWNGIKLLLVDEEIGSGFAPGASQAGEIVDRFRSGRVDYLTDVSEFGDEDREDPHVANLHANAVSDAVAEALGYGFEERGESGPGLAVVDSVNCSGVFASSELLGLMLCRGVQIFEDRFGFFPHTPEPTAENLSGEGGLRDAVPGLKADIGFAQDPDADRLAIIDENGRYIGEEYTLVLCAEALLSAREASSDKPAIVVNLSTSRMIEDVAAKHGAEVFRTPVGEANVVEKMKTLKSEECDVVLGGEGNGGVIWPEVVYIRDSLSAMALVLALMARTGKTVSGLVADIDALSPGGKGYCIVKRKAEIPSKDAAKPAVEAVAAKYAEQKVDLQDGCRVDFDPDGPRAGTWVHVRASNTEPIMRLICEAPTEAIADEVLAEVEAAIPS